MRGGRGGPVAIAVAVALGACGRLDFDPHATAPVSYTGPWQELGGSATGGGITNLPATTAPVTLRLAVGADGRPVVAWTDSSTGDFEVYLRAWDGVAWAELGGSASGNGISNDAGYDRAGGLAVGPDGRPCASWTEEETHTLVMKCWTGSAWVGRDGSDSGVATGGDPWWPQLVFDGDHPMLAWEEYGGGPGSVYVRRDDGTAWQELGGSASGGGVSASQDAGSTTIAAAGGAVWIVWQAADGSDVFAATWTGGAWQGRGGSETGGGVSRTPLASLRPVVSIGDAPYVGWIDDASTTTELGRVYLRAWDGVAWVELGGSATGDGIAALPSPVFYPSLASGRDGEPIVLVRRNGDAHVARWDGAAWSEPGAPGSGGASSTGRADWPELAVAPDGTIVVAWEETTPAGDKQLYLRYLAPDP